MLKPRDTHLEKVCDVCGDCSFGELLIACSKCTIERHCYCMRVLVKHVIEDWICEECLSKNDDVDLLKSGQTEDIHDSSRKVSFDSERQVTSKKNRAVETGKVKFLSTEEVIKLSSGSPQKEFPPKINFRSKPLPEKFTASLSKRTFTGSKTFGPSFNSVRLRPNPSFLQLGSVNPPRHGGVQIRSSTRQQAVKTSEESKGRNFHDTSKAENVNVAEREPWNILLKLPLYRSHVPAQYTTWTGGFKFLDTTSPGEFYGGFLAWPPCKVHRKAFEFSQKMPPILKVNLLHQCHLQANLFQNGCLDLCDIAVYFSPQVDIKRSQQNHFQLFQLMETKNSIMTSYIDGVELLIFTSKQLHVDAQNVFTRSDKDFFCGVFRRVKDNRMKVYQKLPSLVSGLQYTHDDDDDDNANMYSNEVVDMDIDIVGGKMIGIPETVVSNQSMQDFR